MRHGSLALKEAKGKVEQVPMREPALAERKMKKASEKRRKRGKIRRGRDHEEDRKKRFYILVKEENDYKRSEEKENSD